jgi:NAD(P)-dependent dehydrogenase (short-subunit alcohol dehydrogenase family)
MSPKQMIGEPDPERGTGAEKITPGRFNGHVAIITGAASGIGRATARRMAAEGASVTCLDLSFEGAQTSAAEVQADGGTALAVHCDVTDEVSVKKAIAESVAELGRPSIVVNSAGIGGFEHTTEQSMAGWNRMIGVNLTGTFLICRETLPHLLDGGGVIVNVSSTAGVMGQPFSAAYCASKGGVSMMPKALAVEYIDRGVRVNAVAPGGVDTPLVWEFGLPEGAPSKALERIMTPMGFCTPSEVAGAISYLSSDEAAYVSGSILSFDGVLSA